MDTLAPKDWIEFYLKEWEVTIQTQMHFNDLIVRFRSIVLTVTLTLLGAAVTIYRISESGVRSLQLSEGDVVFLMSIPLILWVVAGVLDFFYYHRLLLGSVAHAAKFDKMSPRYHGLFGLSEQIKHHVHPPTSKKLIGIYYVLPVILVFVMWLLRNRIAGIV